MHHEVRGGRVQFHFGPDPESLCPAKEKRKKKTTTTVCICSFLTFVASWSDRNHHRDVNIMTRFHLGGLVPFAVSPPPSTTTRAGLVHADTGCMRVQTWLFLLPLLCRDNEQIWPFLKLWHKMN